MRWQACVQKVHPPCPSRLLLLQRSLGKHANEGGRESCSILILHGWRILWNECELFSPPLLLLPVFIFLLSKKPPPFEAWAEAVDPCPAAPPNDKIKPHVPIVDHWVWIPLELRLSLIGLEDWEPERINGFCWSGQGWPQREWPCVFVPVRVISSALTGEEELKEGQIYPAFTESASGPVNGGRTGHTK